MTEKNCRVNTHALSVTGICVLINSDQRSARVRRGGHMLMSHKYKNVYQVPAEILEATKSSVICFLECHPESLIPTEQWRGNTKLRARELT